MTLPYPGWASFNPHGVPWERGRHTYWCDRGGEDYLTSDHL